MRPRHSSLALIGVVLIAASADAQKHYTDLVYPPLRDLVVPEVERVELSNGLTLYLLEDHALPKVEGAAIIRTGDRLEPPELTGVASLVGQVMRTGGSESRSGEEVDRLLENVGAAVETGIGTTSGNASIYALEEHLPLVLEVLAEILRSPAFPEDKIELAKVQERTSIARRNDDVSGIAGREFRKLLYGAESPYARTTEYATIEAITRDDLVRFHETYFVPNRVRLGLWGDFDAAEVKAMVERFFGSWERGPEADDQLPAVPDPATAPGSVSFIPKDDVNQTNIRIGHLGGRIDDPDYFALTVMSEILGGGFSSRLFQVVRSQRGLAYGVSASWNASFDYPGVFAVVTSTKSETTVLTIRAVLEEIERIAAEPVSDDELTLAKESLLNSFVFNFVSKGAIVRRLMTYDYYGYPEDFLERYQKSIEAVTVVDVHRVAREHLRPDAVRILAVGRREDFDAPLSSLGRGDVTTIDITIPDPPAPAVPEASPESLERGAALVSKFLASAPSAARASGFRLEGESILETPQGKLPAQFQILFEAPDHYRETTVLPFGEIVTVISGEAGWAATPRGIQDLGDDQVRRTREGIYRHYAGVLWASAQDGAEAQWLEGTEIQLRLTGVALRATFDEASGRLSSLVTAGTNLQGAPVEERREFDGFDERGLPTQVRIYHDGALAAETRIESTTLDPTLPAGLFDRPEGQRNDD